MGKGKKKAFILFSIICFVLVSVFSACGTSKEVVIYTSVDRNFSEEILKDFENKTGIKVNVVYDVEAAKSTGLANRLIAEKDNPRADVFWNGEIAQTMKLKDNGILAKYTSPNSYDLPSYFKDKDTTWTAFGGRARVIIVNTELMKKEDYPSSLFDFLDERYEAYKIGFAKPLFGTTATQAAALYAYLGEEQANIFYKELSNRGVSILDGNSVVRDYVADGKLLFGLTDTDDALGAIEKGKPVEIIIPDQEEGGMGTLIVPNTVALINGGPNPENGKKLIDYLLEKETMKKMIETGWCQVTVRDIEVNSLIKADNIKPMQITWEEVNEYVDLANQQLNDIFLR